MVLFRLFKDISVHALILISRLLLCLKRLVVRRALPLELILRLLLLETSRKVWWLIKSLLVALSGISHEIGTIGEWNLLWWWLWLCHLWIHWHVRRFVKALNNFILHSFLLWRLLLLLLICLFRGNCWSCICVSLLILFSSLVSRFL